MKEIVHPWLNMDGRAIDVQKWHTAMTVHKFERETVRGVQFDLLDGREPVWADFENFGVSPDDVAHEEGNLMVTVGLNLLTSLLIGAGGNAFSHANAIVGVGNSSTAAAVGDTHLGGDGSTTTAWYQQADASYPTQANGLITANATVATGNANWAWNEWCFATGSGTITAGGTLASVATGVVMINHKIASLGTKVNTAVWVAQGTITES
jgi:hypothetical protein